MPSPFQKLVNAGFSVAQTFAGEAATLSRVIGDETVASVPITVIPAETRVEEQIEGDNFIVSSRIRDFLVEAVDYVFDNDVGAVDPETGDQITLSLDGVSTTFEVVALAGEREFRTHDRSGKYLRVHTKQVGS